MRLRHHRNNKPYKVFGDIVQGKLPAASLVTMANWKATLLRLNQHNVATFRNAPLAEVSGSLGDLGTLLPLMIALAVQGYIELGSTLVFSGVFNVLTGLVFGLPLPVQPMKVRRHV